MNPATFKSLREAIGLSAQDVADLSGVALRTAQRWETSHEPPADAIAGLLDLVERFNDTLDLTLEAVEDETGAPVDIVRYVNEASYLRAHPDGLPWRVHSQIVSTAVLLLSGEGREVTVHFAPVEP